MSTAFASILHRDAIRRLVDARTFERGQDYFAGRRVVTLLRQDAALVATVRGTTDYKVRLWVNDHGLAYACTCPVGADGLFCKHGVAVGLAWLAQEGLATPPPPEIRTRLLELDKAVLVDRLLEAAAGDPRLREALVRVVSGDKRS